MGSHHGDRVISELIDNPHFLAYIRAQRRFCVQLGFSDSGRYIGQPAASLAIERFKLRLIRLWEARGLQDTQLLIFDTHGESIGRGAHPAQSRGSIPLHALGRGADDTSTSSWARTSTR